MIVSSLKRRGRSGHLIVDLKITQQSDMQIKISEGPVYWKGQDFSFDEATFFDVKRSEKEQWIAIYVVKRLSDEKVILFFDEGIKGEDFGFRFSQSVSYEPMYKIGEIRIPGGAKDLNNAKLVSKRWIEQESEND